MQKKLIVVALAAAFTLPVAAHAENGNFTFYGVADLSYDFVNTGDGTAAANTGAVVSGTSKRVVSSNVSKFGFKGTEDLGDGLSANWQVEQQINFDNSSNSCAATTIPAIPAGGAAVPAVTVPACNSNTGLFATRNTFVNLKSEKLGTILFGRNDTPYKFATRKLDMFGDNVGDNRALMGNKSKNGFELRPTNILMYTTPTFSGFNAAIANVNLQEGNTKGSQANDSLTSFAVMYDVAPFYGSVAHESHKLESVIAGGEESASRVGFAFRPEEKPFEVTAMYEKTNDNLGTAGVNANGHNAYFLGGKYNIGNNAVKLNYVKAGTLGSTVDSGANQVSVGYDHGLSKRTKLYALYTKITNGKGVNYEFSQSSGATSTNNGYGTSPSVVSLGVKHTF
jgi:predicted porin